MMHVFKGACFVLVALYCIAANKSKKLLLAAKWKKWFEFAISLAADDFSQANCVGKLRQVLVDININNLSFLFYQYQLFIHPLIVFTTLFLYK
jgi:hypothetical protein